MNLIPDDLRFSYNWNNKLDCGAFTTIRLRNDTKYQRGAVLNAWLKDKALGQVQIVGIRYFHLDNLNEFIARLDTGYDVPKCREIILRMYPTVDFSKKQLSLILLQKLPAK